MYRYFRHASGEVYVISKALAQFISINRYSIVSIFSVVFLFVFEIVLKMVVYLIKLCLLHRFILRTYAHDDVSTGSWFIGLDVLHIDETKFCCSSWSAGLFLSIPSQSYTRAWNLLYDSLLASYLFNLKLRHMIVFW